MSDEREREFAKKVVKLHRELRAPFSFRMEAEQALEDYATFETFKGITPSPGGLDDQDAVWVEYINIVSSAKNQHERDLQMEQQERQQEEARKAKLKKK